MFYHQRTEKDGEEGKEEERGGEGRPDLRPDDRICPVITMTEDLPFRPPASSPTPLVLPWRCVATKTGSPCVRDDAKLSPLSFRVVGVQKSKNIERGHNLEWKSMSK
jgi:hypothetical protein